MDLTHNLASPDRSEGSTSLVNGWLLLCWMLASKPGLSMTCPLLPGRAWALTVLTVMELMIMIIVATRPLDQSEGFLRTGYFVRDLARKLKKIKQFDRDLDRV